jgi:hypothetical protein
MKKVAVVFLVCLFASGLAWAETSPEDFFCAYTLPDNCFCYGPGFVGENLLQFKTDIIDFGCQKSQRYYYGDDGVKLYDVLTCSAPVGALQATSEITGNPETITRFVVEFKGRR